VKERPILFSGPMVRALLAGSKTQTRRVCKVRNIRDEFLRPGAFHGGQRKSGYWAFRPWNAFSLLQGNGDPLPDYAIRCPYGAPGDQLWVRETWADVHPVQIHNGRYNQPGRAGIPGPPRVPYRTVYRADGEIAPLYFSEEPPYRSFDGDIIEHGSATWKPSIHMPRAASRLTLEVTEVRVERVLDISEEDALAEGAKLDHGFLNTVSCRADFERIWIDINGQASWDANPWVWVVGFKVVGQ
jgi:hypothetical protein